MRLGYERFYVMPQTAEEMSCRVCGSKCLVRREVHGPREFITVTQKVHDVWDLFTLPPRRQGLAREGRGAGRGHRRDPQQAGGRADAGGPGRSAEGKRRLVRDDLALSTR